MALPAPLTHSWPLFERHQRFDLGCLAGGERENRPAALPRDPAQLAPRGTGLWECDLSDNRLTWSPGVYDLFGLPRDCVLERDAIAHLYTESSRAAMERLRAYAIKHRRGFTLDAEIRPVTGERRWMRLIAAPICNGARVVRLHGIKLDVTAIHI